MSIEDELKQRGDAAKSTLEIPTVSEGIYRKTREALKNNGLGFVVTIDSLSIAQLIPGGVRESFYSPITISDTKKLLSDVPPQIEVAIDPKNFGIKSSNFLSTDDQIKRIEGKEAILKDKLGDVGDVISLLKPPRHPSIFVQLARKYRDQTGKDLFCGWYARTDYQTTPGYVANVGSHGWSSSEVAIHDWFRNRENEAVFAVLVAVLPRKL